MYYCRIYMALAADFSWFPTAVDITCGLTGSAGGVVVRT